MSINNFNFDPYEILGVKKDSTEMEIMGAALKLFANFPYVAEGAVSDKTEKVGFRLRVTTDGY